MFLSALQSLIPPLFAVVLLNAPFTSRAKLHGDIPAIEGRTPKKWNIYVVIFWRSKYIFWVCLLLLMVLQWPGSPGQLLPSRTWRPSSGAERCWVRCCSSTTTSSSTREPPAGTACYGLSISCEQCTHAHYLLKDFFFYMMLQRRASTVLHKLILSSLSPSLPQLIEIVGRINVTSSTCVHEFSRFFWRFCRTFGKIFTSTKVKIKAPSEC